MGCVEVIDKEVAGMDSDICVGNCKRSGCEVHTRKTKEKEVLRTHIEKNIR